MIEIENLTKRYRSTLAVDALTFTARPGAVTGFLGPNGSGKTTTLAVLAGLVHPTSGRALIAGRPYADLPDPTRHAGFVLGSVAAQGGRTGVEVLTLGVLSAGLAKSRIDQMLDLVGLSRAEARRRVGTYSLGMQQRLAIAHAMIGDPGVLVLDEPANGLDPHGIVWLRDLLRELAAEGRTVLLSSHVLDEVERIADDVVIVDGGRLVAAGPLTQFEAAGSLEAAYLALAPDRRHRAA